jgi:magnesium transporter
MGRGERWTDLLDPDEAAILEHAPADLHERALTQLAAAPREHGARPTIEDHDGYLFVVVLLPVADREQDRVFLQEVDVVATKREALLVRKTPPGDRPYPAPEPAAQDPEDIVYRVVEDAAEAFLDLVDDLDGEIGELEDNVELWPHERVRARISDLRRDVLSIRKTLAPTREAVRHVADGRVGFDRDARIRFADVHDKLLRASDGLEYARELIASVRDYHQARIASEQNETAKKLAVIAALLLVPTFIVGVYGQNFDHMPELGWRLGYAFSWGLILASVAGLLAAFRWRRWI